MKKTYLYISNSLNNQRFYLCFCLLIVGLCFGVYTRSGAIYNNFFINLTDFLLSDMVRIFLYLAICINVFNIIDDLQNYNILIRLQFKKINEFYDKEIAFIMQV